MTELYIGLMSGTSIDGIDAALVKFKDNKIDLLAFEYLPFTDAIKRDIQTLSQADTPVMLQQYGRVDSKLGSLFAEATNNLISKAGITSTAVTAIGSHGQTIYHAPEPPHSFSLQIGDPNIITENTGITTISDFRRRDIAAGGQGAPLVPAFHQAFFSKTFNLSKQNITIVNIGGIANITYLSANQTIGFDTGPGNTLMDYWTQKNINKAYDKNGAWARTGQVNLQLLKSLKKDPYFNARAPKSTGKEYFSPSWLNERINKTSVCSPENIQANLCKFTADTITEAIQGHASLTDLTLVCGGGTHNEYLIDLVQKNLNHPIKSTAEFGINPDHVEAIAFAWLARQTMHNLSGNITEVTGARTPVILGGIYPGKSGLN